MYVPRFGSAVLILAAGLGVSACSTYGDGYGYSRVSVGYSSRGYCDPYYDRYCRAGYGRGGYYGDPWYGWYDDYYYPGIGIFVYDRSGRRHRWNDNHRRYWEGRRHSWSGRDWNDRRWENWGGYRNRNDGNRNWSGRDRTRRDWNDGDRSRARRDWNDGDRSRGRRDWDRRERSRDDRDHSRRGQQEN